MDKVRKSSNSEDYAPLSELFRIESTCYFLLKFLNTTTRYFSSEIEGTGLTTIKPFYRVNSCREIYKVEISVQFISITMQNWPLRLRFVHYLYCVSHKQNSWVAAQLAASQEGLSSMSEWYCVSASDLCTKTGYSGYCLLWHNIGTVRLFQGCFTTSHFTNCARK
jgi:hypothetical protein